jgi:hypothetical protein
MALAEGADERLSFLLVSHSFLIDLDLAEPRERQSLQYEA